MFVEHLLYAFPDSSSKPYFQSRFVSSLHISPHSQRGRGQGRKKSPIQCHFWKNSLACFRHLWKVSDVICVQEPQHGATESDRHICEGQTDENGAPHCCSTRRGRLVGSFRTSVISWLLQVEAGLKVITPLCKQGNRGPEMDPF